MKSTNTTFGVLFYVKTHKNLGTRKAPICARVTVRGKRTEISIKRSVNANEWDERKGMSKGSRKETVELNMFLKPVQGKDHKYLSANAP